MEMKLEETMRIGILRFVLTLIIISSKVMTGYGQDREVVIQRSVATNEYEEILIKDKISGSVLDTIVIADENPYSLNFDQTKVAYLVEGDQIAYSSIGTIISKPSASGVALTFNYYPQTAEHHLLDYLCEATVIAYDINGNEKFRTVIDAYDVQKPLYSANGEYLGVYFGGLVPEGGGEVPVGFKIFDINNNSVWYEASVPKVSGKVFDDLIIFKVSLPKTGGSADFYVFDASSRKLYKKNYPLQRIGLFKRYENDGIVFNLLPGGEVKEKFEDVFTIIKQ